MLCLEAEKEKTDIKSMIEKLQEDRLVYEFNIAQLKEDNDRLKWEVRYTVSFYETYCFKKEGPGRPDRGMSAKTLYK